MKKNFLFTATTIAFFCVLGYNVVLNSNEKSTDTKLLEFKIQNAAARESGNNHYPDYKNRWLEKGCKAADAICDLS